MPRVSVIVPAFNAAPWIAETLASVRDQTYRDWEVIVADDGSLDATAQIARAAPGVRVVSTPGRVGPAGARNRALAEATGELVAFLDADDLWLPSYLERQVTLFDRETGRAAGPVGIVACDALLLEPDGQRTSRYLEQFRPRVRSLTLDDVLRRNCIYVSTLVPQSVGAQVGWFAPGLFGTEDHDLWIRILETGHRAVLNPETLAVYRLAGGSVSSNVARQGLNNQLTYRRALARGRLTRRQMRIARGALRYNRAMEGIARARFERDALAALRVLPTAVAVAVSNPRRWSGWLSVLRRGDPRTRS